MRASRRLSDRCGSSSDGYGVSGNSGATGNELITNRLEEIEERQCPERIWAKVNKYTTFALRGFGSFNIAMGRGLYSLDLQKSLRREANAPKHHFRELKIRAPLTNRLINGIALVSWGAEDGRIGTRTRYC